MGRPNKQEGEKGTKEKIFDAAIELFANKGFKGTSVREIASALGLTEGAIYRHFSGKDEILAQVFTYAEEVLFTPLPIEETLGMLQGQSIFRGMLEPLPDIISSEPYMRKITRIMFNEMNQNERIAQYYSKEYKQRANEYTIALFEKCMEAGTICQCDVKSLALVFNSFRSEWAYQNFIIDQSELLDMEGIKRELNDVITFFEKSFILKQKYKQMKVLIIGASGMLAKPVINHFDRAGYELRLFSRNVDASMFDKAFEIVKGNALQRADLEKAIEGCDAIHISLAHVNEALTTQLIVGVAKQHSIKCISIITGCTVCEENRWFPMIDNKYRAEKIIMESGIQYMIFRPTWFF